MSLSTSSSAFKREHQFEKRKAEAQRIRAKFTERVPVIVERDERSDIEPIDKIKYLVPQELHWGQFITVIRKRIRLNPEKGLFVFASNVMLNSTEATMGQVYEEHRDEDGFLYVTYAGENTFGGFEQVDDSTEIELENQ